MKLHRFPYAYVCMRKGFAVNSVGWEFRLSVELEKLTNRCIEESKKNRFWYVLAVWGAEFSFDLATKTAEKMQFLVNSYIHIRRRSSICDIIFISCLVLSFEFYPLFAIWYVGTFSMTFRTETFTYVYHKRFVCHFYVYNLRSALI